MGFRFRARGLEALVANMVAQHGYATRDQPVALDYEALEMWSWSMTYPEGDPKHCGLCAIRATLLASALSEADKLKVELAVGFHSEPVRPLNRDEKIDWALGNLNASKNHKTTREAVAAAYDRLHPEG